MTPQDAELWTSWGDAAEVPAVDVALRSLYAELDAAVAAKGPTCWQSGKCCNFGAYGHRLYVTGLEIAWFLSEVRREQGTVRGEGAERRVGGWELAVGEEGVRRITLPLAAEQQDVCPYQVDKLCTTHTMRPLGCRVFFCQRGTEEWQQNLYEDFLKRLQQLHEAHRLEYRYMDWMAGLDAGRCASSAKPT